MVNRRKDISCTSEKFSKYLVIAVETAEYKYPWNDGWKLSGYLIIAVAILLWLIHFIDMNIIKMNEPSGKQHVMCDGW